MSYSSEVRVSVASGNAPQTNVDLTLWELSTTIDGAGHVHEQQTDQDQTMVQVSGGTPFPFSFVRGPSFLMNNNHSIALAAYESGMPGPMFRSGRFDTLPAGSPGMPDGLVDIMLIAMTNQTVGDINSMLAAAMPLTLPDGNTVSTAMVSTAPPSRTVTLVATGPYGATTYTYTLPFTIDPSNDQVNLSNVLEANATGSGSITFVAGPGGGVQAFIDNLLAGLFVGHITGQVIPEITRRLNETAAAAAASAAGAVGVTSIPAGVVLGVRNIAIASNGDIVFLPALGSFGSLITKFVNAAGPEKPTKCFVATATLGVDAPELATLRTFRDDVLLQSVGGCLFVRLYERVSPPFAALLERSASLRAVVRAAVVRPVHRLAVRRLRRRATRTM